MGSTHINKGCGASSIELAESRFTDITLITPKTEYAKDENIEITAEFSIKGGIRDAFNEDEWTRAYEANDVSFKLKYGAKITTNGFRKKTVGRHIDTYRKAAIFWTRNPKLVNPMKHKRIWVQVAKNFEPYIRLTEEEIRSELFDFTETFVIKPSELGTGAHKIGAEVFASWQKHQYTESGSIKNDITKGVEITVLN